MTKVKVGITLLLVAALAILAVDAIVVNIQYNSHAEERHGLDALATRELIECGDLPTAELESSVDFRHLTLCFFKDSIAGVQFTDKDRTAPNAQELTTFSKGRDLVAWFRNQCKDFYLVRSNGDMPVWLVKFLGFE